MDCAVGGRSSVGSNCLLVFVRLLCDRRLAVDMSRAIRNRRSRLPVLKQSPLADFVYFQQIVRFLFSPDMIISIPLGTFKKNDGMLRSRTCFIAHNESFLKAGEQVKFDQLDE